MAKPWFKIHTEKWLTGTTRIELTDAERGRWIDYLALCARHNIDGRKVKQDGLIPMSTREIAWVLHFDQKTVQRDFQKLQNLDKIEKNDEGYWVKNWSRYNPSRDDIYRHSKTPSDTIRHMHTESESESESEIKEIDKEKIIERIQKQYPRFNELEFDACAEWCSEQKKKRVPNFRTCLNWAKKGNGTTPTDSMELRQW